MTENQYEILGDRMAKLYQELEREVIADIARRVRQTGRLTETAELMARAMMETGKSPAEIRKEVMQLLRADTAYKKMVANNTKQYKRDVLHMIRQTVKNAQKLGDELIGQAGDMQWNKDLSLWHQAGKELTKDSSYYKLVQEMQKATRGTLKNLTNTMGFKGNHGYTSIMNAYVNTMDKALIKLTSGAFSMDQCVNDAVRELAHSGLRTIDYASGRSYQLDTAARMALRTANSKLAGQITMNNCDVMGVDLVEVNAHWGSRPEHAVWQGKIYSRSGTHPKYKSIAETRYGHADGLCGINCRHQFYPFFEGISTPNEWEPEPEPQYYKGKEYTYTEATQKQRQMERDIRATKREIEACKVLGDDTTALNAKKNRQIDEYHDFSKSMGIRPKDNRLRVEKGSADVTKTKAYKVANKKEIHKSITLEDIKNANKNEEIKPEVMDKIGEILSKKGALGSYSNISIVNLDTLDAFVTNTTANGNWCKNELIINKKWLGGLSVEEIDNMFSKAKHTVCNSLEDAITHETYHAKLADKIEYSVYNRLNDTAGCEGISQTASKDALETIAEIGVLFDKDEYEDLSEDAKKLFEEYFG